MYEDLTIEEKYLHNFSEAEKKRLFMSVSERRAAVAKKERQLAEKIAADDPNPFISWTIPLGHIACEIKYVLNRIAANDPKGIAFELTHGDSVQNADRLALDIANSFRNNTVCNKVVLSHIGLTDNGMVPLLHALSGKKLYLLDIAGNQVTDKSLKVLDTILANPKIP